jgi:deoxyadenosine/deoxycytidine kinase
VFVPYDTLTTAEQRIAKALVTKQQDAYLTLYDYAFEMKSKVKPDFTVTPEMREEFFQRLTKRGLTLDRKEYDAGGKYIDRMIDSKIASLAFGDSTAKRHAIGEDIQLKKALEYLRKGATTKDLLALASPIIDASPSRKPNK